MAFKNFKDIKFFEGVTFDKDVFDKQDHFELSKEYMEKHSKWFKKITATRLAGVLGVDEFASPFKLWCLMTGIFKDTDMDPMVANVGTTIEPKLRKYLEDKFHTEYSFYDPKEYNWDLWKGIDDVFGGIPDGEPLTNGKPDYSKGAPLIELKTTSIDKFVYKPDQYGDIKLIKDEYGEPIVKAKDLGKKKWFDESGHISVPMGYRYQVGLYMYLRKVTTGLVCCCFVESKDYSHPENVEVNANNIAAATVTINLDKFEKQAINPAREWYNNHIKTGISPKISEKDRQWIKLHLQK